ncbi:MAG TPA: ROK family protein [Phycisphaerae bacterium]|nr:ROK family protein [Phycisphaerae bacterium]
MEELYLGIDMGGTNVKAGVVDGSGTLLHHVSVPTGKAGKDLAAKPVIARMIEAGRQAIAGANVDRKRVKAVGVLSPGQASLSKGIVYRSANLPLWKNVPLRAEVSAGLGLPAVLENDANAAAYGEWWAGAGRKKKLNNLFMFTLGTGVGGGLVYEGKVVRGANDFATEVGHWIMIPGGEKCGCGQHGCLERYCSATYTALRANRQLAESKKLRRKSTLGRMFKETGKVTSADIVAAARARDGFAGEVWDETCRVLALACINVCHFIDPEMIVLAGGMSQAGKFLLDAVNRHLKREWWKMTPPTAKIALAKLGNDAGVIGAAGVAKEAAERGVLPV